MLTLCVPTYCAFRGRILGVGRDKPPEAEVQVHAPPRERGPPFLVGVQGSPGCADCTQGFICLTPHQTDNSPLPCLRSGRDTLRIGLLLREMPPSSRGTATWPMSALNPPDSTQNGSSGGAQTHAMPRVLVGATTKPASALTPPDRTLSGSSDGRADTH